MALLESDAVRSCRDVRRTGSLGVGDERGDAEGMPDGVDQHPPAVRRRLDGGSRGSEAHREGLDGIEVLHRETEVQRCFGT